MVLLFLQLQKLKNKIMKDIQDNNFNQKGINKHGN